MPLPRCAAAGGTWRWRASSRPPEQPPCAATRRHWSCRHCRDRRLRHHRRLQPTQTGVHALACEWSRRPYRPYRPCQRHRVATWTWPAASLDQLRHQPLATRARPHVRERWQRRGPSEACRRRGWRAQQRPLQEWHRPCRPRPSHATALQVHGPVWTIVVDRAEQGVRSARTRERCRPHHSAHHRRRHTRQSAADAPCSRTWWT